MEKLTNIWILRTHQFDKSNGKNDHVGKEAGSFNPSQATAFEKAFREICEKDGEIGISLFKEGRIPTSDDEKNAGTAEAQYQKVDSIKRTSCAMMMEVLSGSGVLEPVSLFNQLKIGVWDKEDPQ
jgi:hypothetical protein